MARSLSLDATSPAYQELVRALEAPEPMCLVVAVVESDTDIAAMVQYRLRSNTRAYDQLWPIDDWSYALTLKTLADASMLKARVNALFDLLATPYPTDGQLLAPTVRVGAAVRQPHDGASSLLNRVGRALYEAESDGCLAPVLL